MVPSSPLTAAGLLVTRGIGESGRRCQVPGVGCQVPRLQTMRTSTRKSLVRGLACNGCRVFSRLTLTPDPWNLTPVFQFLKESSH
jgi:hypothetical protein